MRLDLYNYDRGAFFRILSGGYAKTHPGVRITQPSEHARKLVQKMLGAGECLYLCVETPSGLDYYEVKGLAL